MEVEVLVGCVVRTVGTGWAGHPPANGEVKPSYYSQEIIGLCVKGKIKRNENDSFGLKCLV